MRVTKSEANSAFKFITKHSSNKKVIVEKDIIAAMQPVKGISTSEAEKYLRVIPAEPNASHVDKMASAFTFDRLLDVLDLPVIQTAEEISYDPVHEAFMLYTGGEDTLTLDRLLEVLRGYGGTVTEKDVELLLEVLDCDGDGVVGLEDFRVITHVTETDSPQKTE